MDEKTVWLLGSGFSKPLGGPLLRDLFKQQREEDIQLFFPAEDFPGLAKAMPWVQFCFQNGVEEGLWANAEQFLAYVDEGYQGHVVGKRARVVNLLNRYDLVSPKGRLALAAAAGEGLQNYANLRATLPDGFDRKSKRALAAECSCFLVGESPKGSERWSPYRAWIESLRPGIDTVISFNYDRVIEMAAAACSPEPKLWFAMPDQNPPEGAPRGHGGGPAG